MSQIAGEPATQDFVEVRLPAAVPTCRCCVRRRPASQPVWTSPSTRSRNLRIAVDEACAILLQQAVPGSVLSCVFRLVDDSLEVTVSGADHGRPRSLAGHLRLDRAVRPRGQGLLRRGRGQNRFDQPLQTARRGTRADVRTGTGRCGTRSAAHGSCRPRAHVLRTRPGARRTASTASPSRARPHPEDEASPGAVVPDDGQRTGDTPSGPSERRRGGSGKGNGRDDERARATLRGRRSGCTGHAGHAARPAGPQRGTSPVRRAAHAGEGQSGVRGTAQPAGPHAPAARRAPRAPLPTAASPWTTSPRSPPSD